MCVGEKRILTIPSNLAYGKSYSLSFPNKIPSPSLRTIAVSLFYHDLVLLDEWLADIMLFLLECLRIHQATTVPAV
jgi:hypothetical protein